MKKKISVNPLNKKIFYAVGRYAIEVKDTVKVNKVLGEIIGQTAKTAESRMEGRSNWLLDEIKAIAHTTQDEDLKTYIKQQF